MNAFDLDLKLLVQVFGLHVCNFPMQIHDVGCHARLRSVDHHRELGDEGCTEKNYCGGADFVGDEMVPSAGAARSHSALKDVQVLVGLQVPLLHLCYRVSVRQTLVVPADEGLQLLTGLDELLVEQFLKREERPHPGFCQGQGTLQPLRVNERSHAAVRELQSVLLLIRRRGHVAASVFQVERAPLHESQRFLPLLEKTSHEPMNPQKLCCALNLSHCTSHPSDSTGIPVKVF